MSVFAQMSIKGNNLGDEGKKVLGDSLLANKNSAIVAFECERTGEMYLVTDVYSDGDIKVQGQNGYMKPSEFEVDSCVPSLIAAVAASQSLLSVSGFSCANSVSM